MHRAGRCTPSAGTDADRSRAHPAGPKSTLRATPFPPCWLLEAWGPEGQGRPPPQRVSPRQVRAQAVAEGSSRGKPCRCHPNQATGICLPHGPAPRPVLLPRLRPWTSQALAAANPKVAVVSAAIPLLAELPCGLRPQLRVQRGLPQSSRDGPRRLLLTSCFALGWPPDFLGLSLLPCEMGTTGWPTSAH